MSTHRKYKYVASRLTPGGRGGIATVAIRGYPLLSIVKTFIEPRISSLEGLIGQHSYRRWRISTTAMEDVVVHFQSSEACEIHCHGGVAVVDAILSQLRENGAELVRWDEFFASDPAHAFSLLQIEALRLLPLARTRVAAAHLLAQIQGALLRKAHDWKKQIEGRRWDLMGIDLRQAISSSKVAMHLTEPWRVVLAGPPNVGKSSLINRFLGYERSIVYDQPGTTRDVVRGARIVNGWELEFSDTAGMRTTSDPIESAGCQLAREAWRRADLRISVVDLSLIPSSVTHLDNDSFFPCGNDESRAELVLGNKWDLCPQKTVPAGLLAVSASTGLGCDQAIERMCQQLVQITPEIGAPLLITDRQRASADDLLLAVDRQSTELAQQALAALCQWESP